MQFAVLRFSILTNSDLECIHLTMTMTVTNGDCDCDCDNDNASDSDNDSDSSTVLSTVSRFSFD